MTHQLIYQLIGALGLILITAGVIVKSKKREDIFFIVGGLGLLAYSIYLKDPIFIPLQIIFIITAIYSLVKSRNK